MKFSKKTLIISAIVLIVLLLLVSTVYFPSSINQFLFSAAGLSKQELREGFIAKISDNKSQASPGDLVTYTFTFKHNLESSAFGNISPVFVVEAKGAIVRNISNGGKINNEVVIWESSEMGYGQTVSRTFQLTIPDINIGEKYCVNAVVGMTAALPLTIATASDCTTLVASESSEESISNLFRQVFGRAPSATEITHWQARLEEKESIGALQGAMQFAKAVEAQPTSESAPPPSTPKATKLPTPTELPQTYTTPVNPLDPDGDGLSNDQEAIYGSDPNNFDTDNDGIPDGDEVRQGTNPAGDAPTRLVTPAPEISQTPPLAIPTKQSFLTRFISSITSPWRTITNWFAKLF